MKPTLQFKTVLLKTAPKGPEATIPNLLGMANMQNKSVFHLEEDDEIYEGYGRISNIYPYKDYICYTRECGEHPVKTAVLENNYLKAVFLPEYGGRLWQLTDKISGRELLYTNDVIRPSNLALRDAWFSGGVEWNIGIIGHSPLTMEQMFTAQLTDDKGTPILRMYEYERIRRMVYQMDFWLDEEDPFLNCRMRVVNHNAEVIPMYWWSNMAVPEYEHGRILVPASEAYSSNTTHVYKVDIPLVNGCDISQYQSIPGQVDYFFHIPEHAPRYIANIGEDGYGLLQYSTERLRGRKLFSWGNNSASGRWQEFLTENAGRYVEIQAGLGKTQYGCIPMAPHTAWEWLERYGALHLHDRSDSFEEEQNSLTADIAVMAGECLEEKLKHSRIWALQPAEVILRGSGYGQLENLCRQQRCEEPLSPHLDFSSEDTRQTSWLTFLETGLLPAAAPDQMPADCMADDCWYELLLKQAETKDWHLLYHLGLHCLHRENRKDAEHWFEKSLSLTETPWACYGLASALYLQGKLSEAADVMERGILLRKDDLSYVKEGFQVLRRSGAYEILVRLYRQLPEPVASESRMKLDYIDALYHTKAYQDAYKLLTADGGLEVADLREGENSIAELWVELRLKLGMTADKIPHQFNFHAE